MAGIVTVLKRKGGRILLPGSSRAPPKDLNP